MKMCVQLFERRCEGKNLAVVFTKKNILMSNISKMEAPVGLKLNSIKDIQNYSTVCYSIRIV
jgi:hypothetical protein